MMNPRIINRFDTIAPVYDVLAAMVFGRSIRKAQQYYLNEIRKGGKVLIVGGGTGWLLADLLKTNPECEIWYLEASSRMISMARSNIVNFPRSRVHFIHGTQEQLPSEPMYDAVIANFYFDLFSASSLKLIATQIRNAMLPNGKLLVSDFINNKLWWQSAMLSVMYLFFRGICKIEATSLPNWQRHLINCHWEHKASRGFYRNFIRSAVYEIGEC